MAYIKVNPVNRICGAPIIPPDKSISHRAVMLSSLAKGKSIIRNFLNADDCLKTIDAFRRLGINIKSSSIDPDYAQIIVEGKGLYGLHSCGDIIYLGNSGTSMRLLMGILAGQDFKTVLTGDPSLSKRPMRRVTLPLRQMGADIDGPDNGNFCPLTIIGKRPLKAIDYKPDVPSAQVKSAIMLSGLYADDWTSVMESIQTRDHCEKMLKFFGADIKLDGLKVSVKPNPVLLAREIYVPADISSAAFFIGAGLIVPNSEIILKGVSLNPTRTGLLDVLIKMAADIQITPKEELSGEPVGDLLVRHSKLKAVTLEEETLPRLIDELPMLMIIATQAEGKTIIRNAKELRVKETDRIESMSKGLLAMGANINVEADTIIIEGPAKLKAARVNSFGDHRTAMSFIIAGLIAEGETIVEDTDCIDTSFPNFMKTIKSVTG